MPWAKLDDGIADHPKILEAGPLASWLYVCGITYAARQLTDGFIPSAQVRKLADLDDVKGAVRALVKAGLWEEAEGGYQIHDYLDYQPTREQALTTRAERAKAGIKGGRKSGEVRRSKAEANAKQIASPPVEAKPKQIASQDDEANAKQIASALLEAKRNPIPSHPIPPHPTPERENYSPTAGADRGSVQKSKGKSVEVPDGLEERTAFAVREFLKGKRTTTNCPVYCPEFSDQFWALYPRKEGKREAFLSWLRIVADGEWTPAALLAALERHVPALEERENAQLIPHAATWLNRGDYEGEAASRTSTATRYYDKPDREPTEEDRLRAEKLAEQTRAWREAKRLAEEAQTEEERLDKMTPKDRMIYLAAQIAEGDTRRPEAIPPRMWVKSMSREVLEAYAQQHAYYQPKGAQTA